MSFDKSDVAHSYQPRKCRACQAKFTPPRRPGQLDTDGNFKTHCPGCRRIIKDATLALEPEPDTPILHAGPGAPMRQVVFDLETWGLDRGWGVTLVASFLIHGGEEGPKRINIKHRDSKAWKSGIRSNDKEIVEECFRILGTCHMAYAHNGERFDFRWLRTVALKYGLAMPRLKLVDPCQIAWKRYRLGSNSLEALADFLGVKEGKMHVSPDVWRGALMDDDSECWETLVSRCISDVDLLNTVASHVSGDVGLVDFQGSWK